MGWSSGAKVFDNVADSLMKASCARTGGTQDDLVITPLVNLYKVLSDLDWDNEQESDYWEHPVIGEILGNTFEDDESEE
jgi:hypothetical protein